jgi:DNA-binding NarL/FixJ family response regulator
VHVDTGAEAITVVIADDHPVVRNGLRALIDSLPGLAVVGEAVDGESAVREAQLLRPDVVVMDVRMPGTDGLEATRRITAAVPGTAVLVLTMYEDDDTVFAAMRAGARGYLLKGADQTEIDRALRATAAGEAIFGPGVAARVLGYFAGARAAVEAPFPELTPREREILDRVAAGERNGAIARALGLAPKTVSNHLSSIFTKLAVADRAEAVLRAREGGFGRRLRP